MIYSLYAYHLLPDDEDLMERRKECESGDILCGECKQKASGLLKEFLKSHQEKRKNIQDIEEKIEND